MALVKDGSALAPEERLIETRPPDMAMHFVDSTQCPKKSVLVMPM